MDYWIQRETKAQMALTDKGIRATNAQLKKYYRSSMKKIVGQFEETYNKYLLSISEGKEPTVADLYKLDTYWSIQGQIREELTKLGDNQAALLSKQFENHYRSVYESIALPGQKSFNQIDNAAVKQMVNSIWCADGKSWSQRVWNNTNALQDALNKNLIHCVATGKKTDELKKLLQDQFGVSYHRADTLVRTELAHIQTEAAKERYKDYGIQYVKVLVDEDDRTCDVCATLEGKTYPINSVMPVPVHPNCRCCIIPVVD